MSHALLLAHFDRLVDAPDAIPRLRQLILDLAVRGKLVEQDPKEEPAAVLYGRLKAMLSKSQALDGARSKKGILAAVANFFGDATFPPSWVVTNFDSVNAIASGVAKGKNLRGLKNAIYPYLRVANVQRGYLDLDVIKELEIRADELERYRLQKGDVLMTEGGDWDKLGRAAIWNEEIPICIHQNHIYRIRSANQDQLLPDWIALFANSPLGRSYFEGASKQTTNLASINMTQLRSCPLPIPPIAEQHRIVAKVDELMALCDRLEAAQAERESRRDRLAAASLQRLNQPADAPTFREHARFHLSHLQRLTTRPEQIKQLRQTILNMAVHGQLVQQDPNDEPASLLLTRLIADTKAYCQKRGVPPPKPEPFDEKAVAYATPPNWVWTRLCTLFRVVTDGDHQPPPKSEGGVAFLTIGNITTGQIDFSHCRFVPKEYFDAIAEYRKPTYGDILYTIVGATYGRPAFVETDRSFCVQRHIAILKPSSQIDVKFLCFLLASPLVYEQATRSTTGTAQPTIPLRPLRNFLVPLPPLTEQHRIVAKVDELMALCDRLETQLTATQTQSRRLLEAVLHEALAGA